VQTLLYLLLITGLFGAGAVVIPGMAIGFVNFFEQQWVALFASILSLAA
jgi:hypothetical protein